MTIVTKFDSSLTCQIKTNSAGAVRPGRCTSTAPLSGIIAAEPQEMILPATEFLFALRQLRLLHPVSLLSFFIS